MVEPGHSKVNEMEVHYKDRNLKELWVVNVPLIDSKGVNPFHKTLDSFLALATIFSFVGRRHEVCTLL